MRRDLGSLLLRVHSLFAAMDNIVIDAVLDIRTAVGNAEDALGVGFIFGEKQGRVAVAVEVSFSQFGGCCFDDIPTLGPRNQLQRRPVRIAAPGPHVAEPERRQEMQLGRFRAAVVNADLDQDVLGLWHIRRTRRSIGCRRTPRCRATHTPFRSGSGACSSRQDYCKGTPRADTCRGTSCKNGSASSRGKSNTP